MNENENFMWYSNKITPKSQGGFSMRKKLAVLLSTVMVAALTAPVLSSTANERNATDSTVVYASEDGEATTAAVDMSRLLDMNELYGWAAVPGEGLKGVTGGGKAEPVVRTAARSDSVFVKYP